MPPDRGASRQQQRMVPAGEEVKSLLRPYLIGRGSNLSWILVGLAGSGGVMAFGLLGVFLGPPLLALGYVLMQEWSAGARAAEGHAPIEAMPGAAVEGASAPSALSWIESAAQGVPSVERNIVHGVESSSRARGREPL